MRFQVVMRFRDTFGDFAQNVFASFFSLQQCLFKDFIRQTVYLDIHLGSSDTIFCTGYLEVHIAKVVFITEDVGQYGIFFFACVLNQSHRDTGYGFLDFYTGIHQSQCSGTYGSHGRRTV